jgi:Protein of unknown function (DUF3108)
MARWLVSLSVVLLLVLAAHGIALWTIGQQLQALSSALDAPADPLFTRQITQQAAPVNAPAAVPDPTPVLPPVPAAALPSSPDKPTPSFAKSTASKPIATATLAAAALTTEPAALTSTLSATSALADSRTTASSIAVDTPNITSTSTLAASTPPISTTAASPAPDPAASLAQQGPWPSDTRLTYQLGGYFRGELHGNAQVQWTRPPVAVPLGANPTASAATPIATPTPSDRYQVRVTINVGPLDALLTSQGRIRATGLQPDIYEEKLPNGSRRKVTLEAQDVVLNDGKRLPKPQAPASSQFVAVQDTASQFVELGQRFSTGRARLVPGEVISVWLARPGGLDEWTYDVGPMETINLPTLGAVQAYSLSPRPIANKRGTITAQLWVAPSLQYLPVRIKITLNSETHVDLLVKKIEQR